MGAPLSTRSAQVIDLETVRQRQQARKCLVRLAPELDGLEMVYQLAASPDTYYGLPILAWGLREDGNVVGLVPWMESLAACHELDSHESGFFVGYRSQHVIAIFINQITLGNRNRTAVICSYAGCLPVSDAHLETTITGEINVCRYL